MSTQHPYSGKNLAILLALGFLTLGVTVFLFLYLTSPGNRGDVFHITFVWTLALEALIYACLMSFFVQLNWRAPMRFSLGTTLSGYVVVAALTMIIFGVGQGYLPLKAYVAGIIIESTVYVLITGRLIMLNTLRQTETERSHDEKETVKKWLIQIDQVIGQMSVNESISPGDRNSLMREINRFREILQFSPPYGLVKSGDDILHQGVEENIRKLQEAFAQTRPVNPKTISDILQNLQEQLLIIQKALVR